MLGKFNNEIENTWNDIQYHTVLDSSSRLTLLHEMEAQLSAAIVQLEGAVWPFI